MFLFQIEVIAQERQTQKPENETKSEHIKTVLHDIEKTSDTISKEKNTITINEEKAVSPNNTLVQIDDKTNIHSILKQDVNNKPLIIVDGKKQAFNFKIEDIPTEQIAKIDVLKGIHATTKYGKSGKNGVIEITSKEKTTLNNLNPIQRKTSQGFQILKPEETKNKETEPIINKIDFIITKNTTDEEINEKCEQIKKTYNIDLSFFNIKRNNNGKIINIESKNDVFPRPYKQSQNPIEPFKFFYEKKANGGFTSGYARLSNSISRIIDNKNIDYKKAVIIIDGKQSDYKDLEKVNHEDVKRVITKDIKSKSSEAKKYFELYGEKALYGFLIEIQTNEYYNKNN